MQWIDNKVRECIWEIAQYMSIGHKLSTRPKQWDLLIDHGVTQISDLVSKWLLWEWYMVGKTILDGRSLQGSL